MIGANIYVRHENGGLMLGAYEPNAAQLEIAALPPSFDVAELPLDIEVLRRLARGGSDQFSIFDRLGIVKTFEVVAPPYGDNLPV